MNEFLSAEGGAAEPVRRQAHLDWAAAARSAGLDLTGFDPDAPLDRRIGWAVGAGLLIACVYARFSSKHQHSTGDQVRANVEYAARNRMYVPPEFVCVDEAVKGCRAQRAGVDRIKAVLAARLAGVLLVFKASRLFRKAYEGYRLIQEEIVEEGLRAVSTSQGIDTASKGWKSQIQLFGLMDEALLDTIADFVREGHIGLFKKGYTTGAVGIGLKRVEVPDARPTNRGLPRTRPAVDEPAAELIRRHADLLLDGMPVAEGVRRWRQEGGPADPRSGTGQMSRGPYVRLFTNPRLTGQFEYGRKRNAWSSKRDYTRQIPQPDSAVVTIRCEDLRILSDETSARLQALFADRKTGPRTPRPGREHALWDLVTDVFYCGDCGHRFYVGGANGRGMRCPTPDCPNRVIVAREPAVRAVAAGLVGLVTADPNLVDRVVAGAAEAATAPDDLGRRVEDLERRDRALSRKIADLLDLAGEGSDFDRVERNAAIKAASAERASVRVDQTVVQEQARSRRPITAAAVTAALANLDHVLQAGAAGDLGGDMAYKAADVFRRLVSGRVTVEAVARPGRKKAVVQGRFTSDLIRVVADTIGSQIPDDSPTGEVTVWLREPPRLDASGAEVRRLYEDEQLGFRAIAKRMGIGCGNVYQAYLRYYEQRGEPSPPRRPRGRRSAQPA